MADPLGVLDGDPDGVAAADEQVAGVEAERDAAAGQHAVGLLARLDHGADVRVQGREQAVLRRGVRDPVEVGQQRRPLGVVEHRALVVALRAGGGGDDDRGRLRGDERVHGLHDLRQGVERGVVEHRPERTGRRRAARPRRGWRPWPRGRREGTRPGRTRWPPGRPHASAPRTRAGSSWWPQPGTSHTPHEMGAPATRSRSGVGVVVWAHALVLRHVVGISARSTGRPSWSDTVHASATRKASRASRTVHGLGSSPRATERKCVSSAR